MRHVPNDATAYPPGVGTIGPRRCGAYLVSLALILTSPAGHAYVTTPGSALMFPSLCRAVGAMPAPEVEPPPADYCAERTAMMPKRRRTRAYRIATER